eukprot:1146251-Pelagomonas_calceolata.AAC.6
MSRWVLFPFFSTHRALDWNEEPSARLVGSMRESSVSFHPPLYLQLDFVSSSGGRRLLDSTWNVAADLGESTPARIVRKSRRVVDKAIEEDGGSFQEKLIGDFVVQGKTLTVNEEQTSVTSDPDGECNADE